VTAPPPRSPARRAATVATLTLATWAFGGYSFGGWPQLFPLEHILRLSGGLANDWYTAHPAPHWLFDHALALLPPAALPPVFAALWIAGAALFWGAFAALVADLGVPEAGILAAGLIGARAAFAGFGAVALLTPYLYPSSLACAAWAWGLRFALAGRARAAGVAAGAALLLHPQVGALALATLAPALLRTAGWRRAAGGTALALIVGGVAIARLVLDFGADHGLSPAERFALLGLVRLPHHLIYRAFAPADVVAVLLWAFLLVVALAALARAPRAAASWRAGAVAFLAAIAVLLGAGAVASALGRPLSLVELQTARASAWIPFLALVAAAAALARARPAAAPALFAVPLAAALIERLLARAAPGVVSGSGLPALPLLALMAPLPLPTPRLGRAAGLAGAAALVALGLVASGWKGPPRVTVDEDWRNIARRAEAVSLPGDVVLTPPDLDGFRFYSRRPIVVDFGEVAHTDLGGWRDRLIAACGDDRVLDPLPLQSAAARTHAIGRAYDTNGAGLVLVARRYGARFIVTRRSAPAPEGALPAGGNAGYALFRVPVGGGS
jgi:hypothetical protein